MKKAKLILGAALLAGVAYAASQNFTVIVNGQVSDLQGVVLNNRLYVPADVLPELGIRISAAPGVLSLSSDAGGGSRDTGVNLTNQVSGVMMPNSRGSSNASFTYSAWKATVSNCSRPRITQESVVCDMEIANTSDSDSTIYIRAYPSDVGRMIFDDTQEAEIDGILLPNKTEWESEIASLLTRSKSVYKNIKLRFNVPLNQNFAKYLDLGVQNGPTCRNCTYTKIRLEGLKIF